MGGSVSRIWSEICQIQSDDIRYQMLVTALSSPEYIAQAKRAGVYAGVLTWLGAYREGARYAFPYQVGGGGSASSGTGPVRWQMYSQAPAPPPPPPQSTQLVITPATRALDYFQEALETLEIGEHEQLTPTRLKDAYRKISLRAHPDKGGTSEQFDAIRRAYQYVEQVLRRINPERSEEERHRMSAPVSMERAVAERAAAAMPSQQPPITLSAKKLDMSTFNRLFEENRLPDPAADSGYGDWLKGQGGTDSVGQDPRLKGKFNQQVFESVFRERAATNSTAITRRLEPDAIISPVGTELGGVVKNYTAAFGSDVQFTDVKEAYTTGSTVYQEVANVRVSDRRVRSPEEAKRLREAEMARVDPDEQSRIAAAAAALEERERLRRLNLAKQDVASEQWHNMMRQRLQISNR